jgi:aspartyl-tRNA(Asn)/glutamyl-tRNA(Gln) amidotransferase subunit A
MSRPLKYWSAAMSEDVVMMAATDLVARYRRKMLSPVEVTRAVLDHMTAQQEVLNAFCFVDADAALASAMAAEKRWQSRTPLGLVDGVPTTIKDMFLTRGWPTLRGSRTISPVGAWNEDSPLVARLREQGAVLLGKTTQPEFGWKAVTDSPLTGITRNPWNINKTPGGSSGGAAVAAATGMGALHAGGDGAGSIRIPAAFCGVYGLKPSFGRVPNYPLKMPGSITHCGPITRTVVDSALMLTVMAGPDMRDGTALPYDARDFRVGLEDGVRGLRIAYSATLGYADVDPDVAIPAAQAAQSFADLGATVEEVDPGFENPRPAFEIYYYVRFAWLYDMLSPEQQQLLDPGIVEMAEEGRRYTARDLLESDATRAELRTRMRIFHNTYDLLLTPAVSVAAFDVGIEYPPGRGFSRWLDWSPFTYPFNFTGQPAASVPCGFTSEGLPVAVQIVGPSYRDELVLRASRALEAICPFALPSGSRVPHFQ